MRTTDQGVRVELGEYGDLELTEQGQVLAAPQITRIALALVNRTGWWITATDDGIVVGDPGWGQVVYRPFDLDPVTLTLICRRTADRRPFPRFPAITNNRPWA